MLQYLDLLDKALSRGFTKSDRTGVGTLSLFGESLEYDCGGDHVPVLTTKRIIWKSVATELCWFLRGRTDLEYLHEHDVHIWDANARVARDVRAAGPDRGKLSIGPGYGRQWRAWPSYEPCGQCKGVGKAEGRMCPSCQGMGHATIDQLAGVLRDLAADPNSRRLIVSAWNVGQLRDMALLPCHLLFQFYVWEQWLEGDQCVRTVNLQVYQRSADLFLGVPFNLASYGAFLVMVCWHLSRTDGSKVGYLPGVVKLVFGDAHLYLNHVDSAKKQLARKPDICPKLRITAPYGTPLWQIDPSELELVNYAPWPFIPAPLAV